MTDLSAARDDGSTGPSSEMRPPKASSAEVRPPDAQPSAVDSAPDSRTAKQPTADVSVESAPIEAETALPQVLKIVSSVVAPTTLLTALMFYFGRQWAVGFFGYLGVQFTVLNLTVQDYLLWSSDGLIPPLAVIAGLTLLALWLHQLLLEALPAGARRIVLRIFMPSAAIAGLLLLSLVITDVLKGPVFPTFLEARGLSLSIGVLLLAYAARLLRLLIAERRPKQVPRHAPGAMAVAEWGAVFVLVSVGLFWAVGSYAIGVGRDRAQQIEALLLRFPDVAVYSEKSLSLQAPGIREVICQNSDAAYRFRYEGLKLVPQSGNQYLFLPFGWTHAYGVAVVLPRSEALRLEFGPAGQVRSAPC